MSKSPPRHWRPAAWALLLAALTFPAFVITLSSQAAAFTLLNAVSCAAGFALLWLAYAAWLAQPRENARLRGVRFWLLAALFAGVRVLGQSFLALGTAELVFAHKAKALLAFAGQSLAYFAAMRALAFALDKPRAAIAKQAAAPQERAPARLARRVLSLPPRILAPCFAAALLLCWLPWYACTFPGVVSNDSLTQLREILGVVPLSNGNPIFQTFLIDVCRRIGLLFASGDVTVALYCCTQALLMAWLLGTLLCEMALSAAPRWLCWGSLAFYALCPIFPLFAFCVGKDTNFAMAVLYLSLCVWRLLHTSAGERPAPSQIVGLCLAAVLCALTRNPGVYLALLTLALLLFWTLRTKRSAAGMPPRLWLAPTAALGCTLMVFLALHLLVIPALHILPMPETENYSIPLQQVARVVASESIYAAEAPAHNRVLPQEELHAAYNGELSDPIKLLWREDATAAQKHAFWQTWLSLLRTHPATCLSATFHNTYGYLYPGFLSTIKPTLLIGSQGRTTGLEGKFAFSINPRSDALKAFTDGLTAFAPYRVLIAPGLYGWITLFAFALLLKRGKRRYLLAAVPALFTLAGCLLSAVNAYFRYAMPLYLCAPLLLWLCAAPSTTNKGVHANEADHSNSLL
ncbi:MAG: DUF6020 family protein [Clostridia bacterium]